MTVKSDPNVRMYARGSALDPFPPYSETADVVCASRLLHLFHGKYVVWVVSETAPA